MDCISSTVSSIELPNPSFRISTPNSLAEAAAPYSLAPAGVGDFLEAVDFTQGNVVESFDRGVHRDGNVTGRGGVEGERVWGGL